MRKKIFISLLLFACIVCLELFLSTYFGFGDTVLIREDADYEYIAKPNQNRFRFRNHIKYNAKSMRSAPLDSSAIKILGFGDSVINGGVLTDQNELATTILSDTLSKVKGEKIQFINISAGSWGPDNCYAYLNKNGNFGAKSIFLFVSSHDAFDSMNFEKIVDINKSFPSEQYSFAIYELIDRYLLPKVKKMFSKSSGNNENLGINKKEDTSPFNTGFTSFLTYSRKHNINLTIYLHADRKELKEGKYNEQGKQIIQFANENNIDLIMDLENGLEKTDFRDAIHINSEGQKKMATTVFNHINQ